MRGNRIYVIVALSVLCLWTNQAHAQRAHRNQMEIGVQGGMMYYMGDAHQQMFRDIREAYGAEVSYLFNQRWSLMLQGYAGRISGITATEQGLPDPKGERWTNQLVSIDAVARFNFLPYGPKDKYDKRVKPFTPYIFAGIGMTMHSNFGKALAYVPVGVGLRWVCSPHIGMYLAWQNNICFSDNLEPVPNYDNIHELNGTNILNCDMVSTLQFGIVFEFAREKGICKFCREH